MPLKLESFDLYARHEYPDAATNPEASLRYRATLGNFYNEAGQSDMAYERLVRTRDDARQQGYEALASDLDGTVADLAVKLNKIN